MVNKVTTIVLSLYVKIIVKIINNEYVRTAAIIVVNATSKSQRKIIKTEITSSSVGKFGRFRRLQTSIDFG